MTTNRPEVTTALRFVSVLDAKDKLEIAARDERHLRGLRDLYDRAVIDEILILCDRYAAHAGRKGAR